MLAELLRMKRKGLDFDHAWRIAVQRVRWPNDKNSRREWKQVIAATKETWRQCFLDEGHAIDVEALVSALDQGIDEVTLAA